MSSSTTHPSTPARSTSGSNKRFRVEEDDTTEDDDAGRGDDLIRVSSRDNDFTERSFWLVDLDENGLRHAFGQTMHANVRLGCSDGSENPQVVSSIPYSQKGTPRLGGQAFCRPRRRPIRCDMRTFSMSMPTCMIACCCAGMWSATTQTACRMKWPRRFAPKRPVTPWWHS